MIRYRTYFGMPEKESLRQILSLYELIFEVPSDKVEERMKKVDGLITLCAFHEERVVGFKVGHEDTSEEFYSWIGGAHPFYRKRGIASKFMEMQHRILKERGYKAVFTKTKNKWRHMLLLNLRNGFGVIGTLYRFEGGAEDNFEKVLLKEVKINTRMI